MCLEEDGEAGIRAFADGESFLKRRFFHAEEEMVTNISGVR